VARSGETPPGWRGERLLARTAATAVVLTAVPAAALAGWIVGWPGVLGVAAGLGLVLVLFATSALALLWARRLSPVAGGGVLAAGVGVRLLFYLVALRMLADVPALHRPSLGLAALAGFVVATAAEIRLLSREPRFFWTDRVPRLVDSDRVPRLVDSDRVSRLVDNEGVAR
jgi:hypothetical protein